MKTIKPGTYWIVDKRDSTWTILHIATVLMGDAEEKLYMFLGHEDFIDPSGHVDAWLQDDAIVMEPLADKPPTFERPQGFDNHNPKMLEDNCYWPMLDLRTGKEAILSVTK